MRKQGLMKRVLGGVMAIAFGAALCFAAPVKAEAASPQPYSVPVYNQGELLAYGSNYLSNQALAAAEQNMARIQLAVQQQLQYGVGIAQTDMIRQQTNALLGAAFNLTGSKDIYNAMGAVNLAAYKTIGSYNDQVDAWRRVQVLNTYYMNNNISAAQAYGQMAALGANVGQLQRQIDSLMGSADSQLARMAAISPDASGYWNAFGAGIYAAGVTGAGYADPENLWGIYYR